MTNRTDRRSSQSERDQIRPVLLLGLVALVLGASVSAQGPPADTTYFVAQLGFAEPYAWTADCVSFSDTEFCTSGGRCGQWYATDSAASGEDFAIEMDFLEYDIPVRVDGQSTIDSQGRNHSLSGAGTIRAAGTVGNFGFSGRPVSRRRCFRLLGEWDLEHKNVACVARIEPRDPSGSLYILPFPVGVRSRIKQSYCMLFDSHANDFAYDFQLPIGTEVLATRAGVVLVVEDTLPDDPFSRQFNSIVIEHEGAASTYSHIARGSARVDVGEMVDQGQIIARTGLSATEAVPHLHFDVRVSFNNGSFGEPFWVEFSNAGGPLDTRGGLMRGRRYRALPIE